MKKILLGTLIAFSCFQFTNAQTSTNCRVQSEKVTPEKMVQRIDRAVGLNKDQEQQLLSIYSDFFNNRKSLKTAAPEERTAMREEISRKINAVLTEEQQQKWEEVKKQSKIKRTAKLSGEKAQKRTMSRGNFSPEKMVQRMDRAVGLDENQQKQLLGIYTEYFKGSQEMKNASREDRRARREEMGKKINEVLTVEQQQKWEEVKKQSVERRKAKMEKAEK